ncbi:MAG: flagellar basal body L-ring protein FlgH [Filomicrobium sp.]
MRPLIVAAACAMLIAGCAIDPKEIGREPTLSPVGTGVVQPVLDIPSEPRVIRTGYQGQSFWRDSAADLFKDPRARRIGDVLTVKISIKDKAALDNNSKRSRDATNDFDWSFSHDILWRGWASSGEGSLGSAVDAKTDHEGKGAIERSESIDLLVAAVVSDVLPNGTLIIKGSQEVRVNYELRVLTVSGIVDPKDIKSDNTVSYERIAEARISYGGRGRLMEVQQPGWGHQIVDAVAPF